MGWFSRKNKNKDNNQSVLPDRFRTGNEDISNPNAPIVFSTSDGKYYACYNIRNTVLPGQNLNGLVVVDVHQMRSMSDVTGKSKATRYVFERDLRSPMGNIQEYIDTLSRNGKFDVSQDPNSVSYVGFFYSPTDYKDYPISAEVKAYIDNVLLPERVNEKNDETSRMLNSWQESIARNNASSQANMEYMAHNARQRYYESLNTPASISSDPNTRSICVNIPENQINHMSPYISVNNIQEVGYSNNARLYMAYLSESHERYPAIELNKPNGKPVLFELPIHWQRAASDPFYSGHVISFLSSAAQKLKANKPAQNEISYIGGVSTSGQLISDKYPSEVFKDIIEEQKRNYRNNPYIQDSGR